MERTTKKIQVMLGTLGWLLLGIVMMRNEIGPWWVGWLSLTISFCTMMVRMGHLLNQKEGWEI